MAKILAVALFNSKEEGQQFWPLLEPLRQQNHEVTLLTNHDFAPASNQDIDIWGAFKSGSLKEGVKVFPRVVQSRFEIVHFFHFQEAPSPAHHMLLWYFQRQPRVVIASSLMKDETHIASAGFLKMWLQNSDIVTGFDRHTLAEMRTLQPKSNKQCKVVLPPLLSSIPDVTHLEWSEHEAEFLEEMDRKKNILVPYFPTHYKKSDSFWSVFENILSLSNSIFLGSQNEWHIRDRHHFLSWSDQHNLSKRWLLAGNTDERLYPVFAKKARIVWLAGLPLSSFDVVYWLSCAFSQGKSVVVDSKQASLYPELLAAKHTWCHVLPLDTADWETTWKESIKTLSKPPSWMEVQHHADSKINDLSRIYEKVLGEKA
ncbi:MAG: hypothetical protein V4736_08310 [Bdellovibrionota bacterium]